MVVELDLEVVEGICAQPPRGTVAATARTYEPRRSPGSRFPRLDPRSVTRAFRHMGGLHCPAGITSNPRAAAFSRTRRSRPCNANRGRISRATSAVGRWSASGYGLAVDYWGEPVAPYDAANRDLASLIDESVEPFTELVDW